MKTELAVIAEERMATRLSVMSLFRDLQAPLPHLHRDWAHPRHICTGTGITPCHVAFLRPVRGGTLQRTP
jgi:hypothetical protein